jgi:hypothetical protein
VFVVAESDECKAQLRSAGQIEWALSFAGCKFFYFFLLEILRERAEIEKRNLDCYIFRN